MRNNVCDNCKWWLRKDSQFGYCRGGAPQITERLVRGELRNMGVWPETPYEAWCLNFQEEDGK